MAKFTRADDLRDAEFYGADLRGARFGESDLSGVVMRGVDIRDADIDAPWLADGDTFFRINGVDVVQYVETELDRRFPGRADRRAQDPDALRAAWATLEGAWAAALDRAAAMPPGAVDASVAGEWSFAQTLRHLVFATDTWLGRGILELDQPYHPVGQADSGTIRRMDESHFATDPPYDEVLEARADRAAMVRDLLATVTAEELDAPRKNPHEPERPETTRSCLHVILEEEWEHLRFALRDLDTLTTRPPLEPVGH